MVQVARGESTAAVTTAGGTITLNLVPIVNNVIAALEQRLPDLFGKDVNLPQVKSGDIPPNLETRIEDRFGVTLPSNFGHITIYQSSQLDQLQKAVVQFQRFLILLVVASVVATGLAILVSPRRRRTALQFGVLLAAIALTLWVVLRAVVYQVLGNVESGVYREGLAAAIPIIFDTLRTRGIVRRPGFHAVFSLAASPGGGPGC